jgi:hypothetical protein
MKTFLLVLALCASILTASLPPDATSTETSAVIPVSAALTSKFPESQDLTANSTMSEHAPQPKQICTSSNWSNANAWWFLATLALGCLAHPRGSLVFNRAGRLWRVSPIFLIIEDIVICFRLYEGIWGPASKSNLQICSHSLLALKEGNSWSQDEFERFQRTEYKPNEGDEGEEDLLPEPEGDGDDDRGTTTGNDAFTNSIQMRALASEITTDIEEDFQGPAIPRSSRRGSITTFYW